MAQAPRRPKQLIEIKAPGKATGDGGIQAKSAIRTVTSSKLQQQQRKCPVVPITMLSRPDLLRRERNGATVAIADEHLLGKLPCIDAHAHARATDAPSRRKGLGRSGSSCSSLWLPAQKSSRSRSHWARRARQRTSDLSRVVQYMHLAVGQILDDKRLPVDTALLLDEDLRAER